MEGVLKWPFVAGFLHLAKMFTKLTQAEASNTVLFHTVAEWSPSWYTVFVRLFVAGLTFDFASLAMVTNANANISVWASEVEHALRS